VKESKYNIAQPLLLAIVLAAGMLIGYRLSDEGNKALVQKQYESNNESVKSINEVLNLIDNKYLYKTNSVNLADNILNSVVDKLDPFSRYINSNNYDAISDRLEGHFTGLGIESLFVEDTLFITNVLDGSPADKAELKSMDRVVQVGNASIVGEDRDVSEVRDIIKKYKGKDLDLVIVNRRGMKVPVTVNISNVERNSINKNFLLKDSIVYLSISQFTKYTYRDFMEILESYAKNDKLGKLIIDLRNNPGGYLREVTKILDQFFETSKLIMVKTVYKDGRVDVLKTSGRTFYSINDIVVLINENSASGSEVLAGVLQDYDRATIIGKQSFGKGLVQEQFKLDNGGALRLTIANYFLPTGRSIQKVLNLDSNFVDLKSSHYEKKDTFYSMKKSRPLISGRGIYPDIEVEDAEFNRMNYLFWEKDSLFLSWSIEYIKKHPELLVMDENKFLLSSIPLESDIVDIKEKLHQEINNPEVFLAFMKSRIGFILYGYNAEGKLTIIHDPYLHKAIEYFSKSKK